jgi:uncharacterized protein YecE (DUF72 family)
MKSNLEGIDEMTRWFVGTMGFGYKPWQGTFYPDKLPREQQLPYYTTHFNALEMDSTFYGTPKAEYVARWQALAPDDFQFCPKVPRSITHDLRLSAAEGLLAEFLDTMRLLGDNLGPIVFQFPPDYRADQHDNLEAFLRDLPRDIRFAIELRHRSWWNEATAEMFQAINACWVAADYIYLPKEIKRTSDFLYLRFLGRHGQFATKTHEVVDKTADLRQWRAAIEPHLEHAKAVYAFFNDDYAGHSPATANRFKSIVGLKVSSDDTPRQDRLL